MFAMRGIVVTRNIYDMIATRLSVDSEDVVLKTASPDGQIVYVDRTNISSIGFHEKFYKFCHFALSNGTAKIVVKNEEIYEVMDLFRKQAAAR